METQDYAFESGLTVGELLKSSQKDWQAAINHRFVKELFAGTIENKVLKDYLIQDYHFFDCLLYTSPSPRDGLLSRMPSSA